ncbi:MAG: response regulator transcription factor [Chloroflexi bacterium]|nr:response regulator transcription factor [Chloroflexota bacterium]
MKPHLALWAYLRRALRSLIFASRIMRLEGEIGRALQDLARRELRPEDEIAADLLTNAIARHQAAETNLRRWHVLTPREQEVSALTCLNLTNVEIAKCLMISPETVKTHVRNVLAKFNLRSKSELRQVLGDWDFSAWAEANVTGKEREASRQGELTP